MAVIFHTFDALESDIPSILHSTSSVAYGIDPLHLLLGKIPEDDKLESIESNLLKEDAESLQ